MLQKMFIKDKNSQFLSQENLGPVFIHIKNLNKERLFDTLRQRSNVSFKLRNA